MTFIQDFELELERRIAELYSADVYESEVVVRWVSEKILESYRNGITAGRKGETVKRSGKSRRTDSFGNKA